MKVGFFLSITPMRFALFVGLTWGVAYEQSAEMAECVPPISCTKLTALFIHINSNTHAHGD